MEKRFISALVLSVLVMLIFNKFFTPPVQQLSSKVPVQYSQVSDSKEITKEQNPPFQVKQYPKEIEKLETIETDKFILTFSNIGASLKQIYLKDFDANVLKENDGVTALFSVGSEDFPPINKKAVYSLVKNNGSLIYTYVDKDANIKITKHYNIYKDLDNIDLYVDIENIGTQALMFTPKITTGFPLKPVADIKGRNYIENCIQLNGNVERIKNIKGKTEDYKGIIAWTAEKNRYFTIAVILPKEIDKASISKIDDKDYGMSVEIEKQYVKPSETKKFKFIVYLGPLDKQKLAIYNEGLENIVNYGFFGGISSLLLSLLGFIYKIVHNWGVAIIVVTCIINVLIFPLTKKSMSSMHSMQKIQPHMEKLRETHKDNPQRMNKEMMELYKQYNVNPFGGCLPMLLQFPIFISFYSALMYSTHLKNAHFLWIKDLSSPDALFTFASSYPLIGNKFNLLPIITLILMMVQQRIAMSGNSNLNSDVAKQQKMMSFIFPIFFGFILYNFPSGLVLYWLTNSIVMSSEQYLLKKGLSKA